MKITHIKVVFTNGFGRQTVSGVYNMDNILTPKGNLKKGIASNLANLLKSASTISGTVFLIPVMDYSDEFGQTWSDFTEDQRESILAHLRENRRIYAIRTYRGFTGAGLKRSVEFINWLLQNI